MKIVFVSNFLNHHQIPFCDALLKKGVEFWFVATKNGDAQGYQTSTARDYLIDYKIEREKADAVIDEADAVIFGDSPLCLIERRMKEDKLSFIYSERIFKRGLWQRFIPKNKRYVEERYLRYKNKNLYVLSASAFLAYDLSLMGFPGDKIFKWGYFPECHTGKDVQRIEGSVLYAGRFLKWKHAETVIEVAKRLRKDGLDFKVTLIGSGPEKEKLVNMVNRYCLNELVEFCDSKPHSELMDIMRQHEIYMFTSDFNEGWGAVLNEAMANGCAVVASHASGSVPFLLKQNKTGKIYHYGNNREAYEAVKELLKNQLKARKMGESARDFIEKNFTYQIAVERFVKAVDEFLQEGYIAPAESGVFSKVDIIKNNWI